MKEIELRARVKNESALLNEVSKRGWKKAGSVNQYDTYFKKKGETERTFVIRLREREGSYELTFKGDSKNLSWDEITVSVGSVRDTVKLLNKTGLFEKFMVINKRRVSFKKDIFELNMDYIENLGVFIEIEVMHDSEDVGRVKLLSELKSLGIPEEDIIEKGYVVLMEEKNGIL